MARPAVVDRGIGRDPGGDRASHQDVLVSPRLATGAGRVGVVAYSERPATDVAVVAAMDYWPDKQAGDVGWAYAAIWGEGFSEAVTVTVAEEGGRDVIRVLEWGRP